MSVYEIAAVTTVALPPEHIWAVLDDFSGWPAWMPAMENLSIELLSSGAPRPGYQFRIRGNLVHADLEVTDYGPLERVTRFKLSFPPITGDNSCRLIPLDQGRYRLERIDHIVLPGAFIDFLNATQRKRFEKLAAEFLTALTYTAHQRYEDATLQTREAH
jgi:hypothetical protein